ncbi:MAG: hypothetical protein HeimC3_49910 [Candidatus Heimdallarchaeota archaeon LC_3]|nr:MAG: hypothetical protein HeimC3_49910 [Candidatus Heimdallarchaeota archaeon LC_3]
MISKKKRIKISITNIHKLYKIIGFHVEREKTNVYKNSNQKFSNKEIRKDFHRMKLYQVKDWLFTDMVDYFEASFNEFFIIHGYNHGTVIRDYIRNDCNEKTFYTKLGHPKYLYCYS